MKSSPLSQLGRRTTAPPISWLMEIALARPQLVSLAAGFTDNPTLPVEETREIIEELMLSRETGQRALQYGNTNGDPHLRQLTARNLARLDGRRTTNATWSPDRMIITNGSQQMLYMITEALCDPGDIVLVEDPTYFVYLGIIQSHGLQARGIRLQEDGLDLDQLEAVLASLKRSGDLRRVKLLYLVTYYQNPTGVTTSFVKKTAALNLLRRYERAAGHPIYLLEDAAYRELRFRGDDVRSGIAIPGAAERVIYAGTYSKPFATGSRVGFGLLPEALRNIVLRIKANHDFGTSNLLQQLLARAITTGRYETQLVKIRHRYAAKAREMLRALLEHFPDDADWWEPHGGLYVWARLPRRVRTGPKSRVFAAALRRNVLYVPGVYCYGEDPTRRKPDHEMRLSFGAATDANIRHGIARLGLALQHAGRR